MSTSPSKLARRLNGPRSDEVHKTHLLPNGAILHRRYDFLGQLLHEDAPDGSWLHYRYAPGGRLECVLHSSGARVDYTVDAERREWRAATGRVTTIIQLDANDAPLEIITQIDGRQWAIGYQRDAQGRVTALRYPQSGAWTTFKRPSPDTLTLRCGEQRYCNVQGDAAAARTTVHFVNGITSVEELGADPPRLTRVAVLDSQAIPRADLRYAYDSRGRIRRSGDMEATYDESGRLGTWTTNTDTRTFRYDERGRLTSTGSRTLRYGDSPMVAAYADATGEVSFEYDLLGRRTGRCDSTGVTRYSYDLFGQLASAELPDGSTIRYLYDGWGRLVAREADDTITYYLVDLDGHRLAEADEFGRIVASYLWLGTQCVARIDGVMGERLACTFHRSHGGGLIAVGDAAGATRLVAIGDPFGAEYVIDARVPGYAGLFGDPATGLLHAGARWLDPAVAQFLTPDSWFGEDVSRRVPATLRKVMDARPGGTARLFTPETAYAWCAYDPLNFNDPSGHNWLGLIFTTISALLWEMQLTSVSLQMQVINFILDTLMVFPVFRPVWDTEGYWHTSVYNTAFPVASYRLMVPFALIMNGLLNVQNVAWTLGSVIWARGSEFRKLESEGKRDVLICSNAQEYVAATQAVASDLPPTRPPGFRARGTVSGNGRRLTGVTVTSPAGLALTDLFALNDRLAVWPTTGAGGEIRNVKAVDAAGTIDLLGDALPDSFRNQTVDVTHFDTTISTFRARNSQARASGTVAAGGVQITGVAITAPAGSPLNDVFNVDDLIAVRPTGGTSDHLRRITTVSGTQFDLDPALPNELFTQSVEITRLDRPVVKIEKDSKVIARLISFIRGQALHFAAQIPADFPTSGLRVSEHLTDGIGKARTCTFPAERRLIRMAQASDLSGYAADDFVRIGVGGSFVARRVERVHPPTNLFLDSALTGSPSRVEIVKLTSSGTAILNQRTTNPARDRVSVETMAALQLNDGLTSTNGGASPTTERRIAIRLFLDCTVDAVPLTVQGARVSIDLLSVDVDPAKRATGQVTSATQITTEAGQAARLQPRQPVRITKAPDQHAYNVIETIDVAANRLTLRESLPSGDFGTGTAVTVTPMNVTSTVDADNIDAPGEHLIVHVRRADAVASNAVVLVRPHAAVNASVTRVVKTPPTLIAGLDSALPSTHTTGLSMQRFVPDATTNRTSATAPLIRYRLNIVGGTSPFSAGDTIFLDGSEETIGQVHASSGSEIVLQDPVELPMSSPVRVEGLKPGRGRTNDGRLDEGVVLVPSDLNVALPRRQALEHHEMRHVFQGAIWGPFLLSLPIPWLINLGFSFTDSAHGGSEWVRHFSLGGIDSFFAWIFSGFSTGGIDVSGQVAGERNVLNLAADTDEAKLAEFSQGAPITVTKGDFRSLNFVKEVNTGDKRITLRFGLDATKVNNGDTVTASVSHFEKTRQIVNTWFSLNLERLWSDHIPTAWGRALSRLLNRDSWFPLIGIYPLAWLVAGTDRERIPVEQDASYHSGDLYNTIVLSHSKQVYVGQFARIYAFVHARGGTADAAGLSKNTLGPLHEILKVERPTGVTVEQISGAIPSSDPTQVRFRENWQIPMQDRAENVVGAFFATTTPGTYQLRAPGTLTKELVFKWAFDVSFTELSKVEVLALGVEPNITQPVEMFETEQLEFRITDGDTTAQYGLRYSGGSARLGTINTLRYAAPVLAPGSTGEVQKLELTATYPANHAVFAGPGQSGPIRLSADERTNRCHEPFDVRIKPLTVPTIPGVAAGSRVDFQADIAPVSVTVRPLPAGTTGIAQVINHGGKPARLTFIAPAAVTAAIDVTIDLVFGVDPVNRRTVSAMVRVNPS